MREGERNADTMNENGEKEEEEEIEVKRNTIKLNDIVTMAVIIIHIEWHQRYALDFSNTSVPRRPHFSTSFWTSLSSPPLFRVFGPLHCFISYISSLFSLVYLKFKFMLALACT